MAGKRKIGIIYEYNEDWIGGTYYIQNLISALNLMPAEKKPELLVFSKKREDFDVLAKVCGYPYLKYRDLERRLTLVQRGVNKFTRILFKRNVFSLSHKNLDVVFPFGYQKYFSKVKVKLYWIPDFQEHYLPEFFSEKEILGRKKNQVNIVETGKYIVFSSESAKRDFNKFYPDNKLEQFLLRFAVTHPAEFTIDKDKLQKQFKIPAEYFICSNQFWKHKNHPVILKAIRYLKERGTDISVVLTGKEHDYRNPNYFAQIERIVDDLGIRDNVHFLGFIERNQQLALMRNSLAVVQPSLFEGWSTVIEDGKALGIPIIASGIDVHKEQLAEYEAKYIFSPLDFKELAECFNHRIQHEPILDSMFQYQHKVKEFGERFLSVVEQIS